MSAQSNPALTFTRPSRSAGPDHVIQVSDRDLCPEACSCLAGRHGIVCHAVLELAAGEDLKILALQRWQQAKGMDQLVAAAKVWDKVLRRSKKAADELARREAQRVPRTVDEDAGYVVTDAGRDALARAAAEAWLFGRRPATITAINLGRVA
jgi:hypothetical protein